jgi:hypothetical protein
LVNGDVAKPTFDDRRRGACHCKIKEAQFLEASLGVLQVLILLLAGRWVAFSAMRLAAQAAARSLLRS